MLRALAVSCALGAGPGVAHTSLPVAGAQGGAPGGGGGESASPTPEEQGGLAAYLEEGALPDQFREHLQRIWERRGMLRSASTFVSSLAAGVAGAAAPKPVEAAELAAQGTRGLMDPATMYTDSNGTKYWQHGGFNVPMNWGKWEDPATKKVTMVWTVQGPKGVAGHDGPDGLPGPMGSPGPQGTDMDHTLVDMSTALGPPGPGGHPGFDGDPGLRGIEGPQGPAGAPGQTIPFSAQQTEKIERLLLSLTKVLDRATETDKMSTMVVTKRVEELEKRMAVLEATQAQNLELIRAAQEAAADSKDINKVVAVSLEVNATAHQLQHQDEQILNRSNALKAEILELNAKGALAADKDISSGEFQPMSGGAPSPCAHAGGAGPAATNPFFTGSPQSPAPGTLVVPQPALPGTPPVQPGAPPQPGHPPAQQYGQQQPVTYGYQPAQQSHQQQPVTYGYPPVQQYGQQQPVTSGYPPVQQYGQQQPATYGYPPVQHYGQQQPATYGQQIPGGLR